MSPRLSCTVTHFARSATQELMAPAGALLSTSSCGSGSSLPPALECGRATSPAASSAGVLVFVEVMPSGVKMRSFTKSSQLFPVTAGMIWPATRYNRLSYAYRLRKLVAGLTNRSRRIISSRLRSLGGKNIRSPAPSPSPLRCTSRSLTVSSRVTYGSYIWKPGVCSITASSHRSLPSSTSMASAAAVKALVLEAMRKSECGVTGAGSPSFRTPYPLARTTLPSLTMATAIPGTSNSLRARSTTWST